MSHTLSMFAKQSPRTTMVLLLVCGLAHAQAPELLIATDGGQVSSIDTYVGINDAGTVAFSGTDASGNSRAFIVTQPNTIVPVTFFSSNRIFTGAAINNSNRVATRDRVTGNPPLFLIRTWLGDGSLTNTLVG